MTAAYLAICLLGVPVCAVSTTSFSHHHPKRVTVKRLTLNFCFAPRRFAGAHADTNTGQPPK